ncbi:hypothetical protein DFS34DRAFT_614452 [Phlyctochytrium arcticum]|nr:hypothetical protein DFS34DRAFT_614452 [Phlyctochytrium arcticum]
MTTSTAFSPDDIRALRAYKYSGVDKSVISRYVLNPYWWNQIVKVFPLWFAPNLITLSGLSLVIFNVLTLLYYSPDLQQPCPNWVYYSFSIGLFLYQSLDAIDGKQARRTGTSGPLGEMFDHGCDAINTTLGGILVSSAMNLHQSWWLVTSIISALANFYLSTWEEYHTGTLYLSYCSGPVEGILLVVFVFAVSGYKGAEFWDNSLVSVLPAPLSHVLESLGLDQLQLNHYFLFIGAIVVFFNVISGGLNVIKARRSKALSAAPAFLGLLPFIVFASSIISWLSISPTALTHHLVPVSLLTGCLFAHQVGKMILAHVCKRPFPYVDVPMLGMLSAGNLSAWIFRVWGHNHIQFTKTHAFLTSVFGPHPPVDDATFFEGVIIYSLLALAVGLYLRFAVTHIHELCEILDCYCLTIKKKVQPTKGSSLWPGGKEGRAGTPGRELERKLE